MKTFLLMLLSLTLLATTACSRKTVVVKKNTKPLPPGQAKKITGSQSAAPYAPGQQKKKH